MNIIKDTENIKIYNEIIKEYNLVYTFERTSFPYYMLSKIDMYKDNILLLNINASIRNYDGHTLGAEYKRLEISSKNSKRVIDVDCQNTIIGDFTAGNKDELKYYEEEIFDGTFYTFFYDKNIKYGTFIEKKKKKILSIFNKNKSN